MERIRMRKKKKMLSGVRSGITVYGGLPGKNRAGQQDGSAWVLNAVSVCLLAAAWWNAVLSVFPFDISRAWLYGCLAAIAAALNLLHRKAGRRTAVCIFLLSGVLIAAGCLVASYVPLQAGARTVGAAAAAATIPLLESWTLVKKTGRGKAAAGLLIPVPLIAAACAGSFQPAVPCWLLLIAGGFYFASGSGMAGHRSGISAWIRSCAVLAVLCLAAVLSASAGRLLDIGRSAPGGYYQEGRDWFSTGIAERLERMVSGLTPDETGEETDSSVEDPQAEPEDGQEVQEEIPERETGQGILEEDGGMEDLNSLSRYTPTDAAVGDVTVDERPSGTVYVPEHYGITYTGNAWIDMEDYGQRNWETVYGSGQYVDTSAPETLLEACQSYPSDLSELEGLIGSGWDTSSIESVGREIDREFALRAVYDTAPGATPQDEDFVEYFLFERGRGFCVHFASAAVLLYRMSGYPARYVSGYAVPASAFRETENGEYQAQIDGTMGHAWAQVYDGQTGVWLNEEHTPSRAASSTEQNTDIPQPDSGGRENAEPEGQNDIARAAERLLTGLLILAAVILTVLVQAGIRRRRLRRKFSRKRNGEGIICMYDSILSTSKFIGCSSGKMPDEELTGRLSEEFPEITAREWKWMEERTLESMFYHLEKEEDEWKKMAELYCRFQWAARGRMNRRKRWMYDYISCCGCVYKYTNK